MKKSILSSGAGRLILIGMAATARAQQPPDVVSSDASYNTAMGTEALFSVLLGTGSTAYLGSRNTAVGWSSLLYNSSGYQNTAVGFQSMWSNLTGHDNVAIGPDALYANTSGDYNTGVGSNALPNNTTGITNTALGSSALWQNTSGSSNSAAGNAALSYNTTGSYNSALGSVALGLNKTGSNGTAVGANALVSNTVGNGNTAVGYNALASNTLGHTNVALGENALSGNTTGSHNVGIGLDAGAELTTGSNNIDVGSEGVPGESGAIRIGVGGTQVRTFIAGINTSPITGAAVVINSEGRLGVLASSERYKTGITSMGAATQALGQLRPVSFHLKSEPDGQLQYGLIAEEVAAVYPELVIRDAAGTIQGVRYDELAPMLLNEVQQQRAALRTLQAQLAEMQRLHEETRAALRELEAK
jgi:hypothetical protein